MQDTPSYWEQMTFLAPFDILIVGGGIVGCAAALHCATSNPSLRIGLVERGSLPKGASTRNAGFATFGSISEICGDLDSMGEAATLDLIKKRKNGLQELFRLIPSANLGFVPTGGYEVFLQHEEAVYENCLEKIEFLNDALVPLFNSAPFVADDSIADAMQLHDVAHVIHHPFEGVLHPGKMMQQFTTSVQAAGISLFNGFEIQHLISEDARVRLLGAQGIHLTAKYCIVATNAFALQLVPAIEMRPARNQVYLTGPIDNLALKGCFHYDHGFIYFREVDGRVLIGGARNADFENENTSEFGLSEPIRQQLVSFLGRHILPETTFDIEYAWSGIIGIGEEKSPIVKMVDERIAVAVRLSGMGVAIGSLVGAHAAQLVLARL